MNVKSVVKIPTSSPLIQVFVESMRDFKSFVSFIGFGGAIIVESVKSQDNSTGNNLWLAALWALACLYIGNLLKIARFHSDAEVRLVNLKGCVDFYVLTDSVRIEVGIDGLYANVYYWESLSYFRETEDYYRFRFGDRNLTLLKRHIQSGSPAEEMRELFTKLTRKSTV
jgi:hypothetical protein